MLLTGKDPAEAGVFVSGSAVPRRAQRSRLADRAREELGASNQRLSAEQRLDAQMRHSELLAALRRGALPANHENPGAWSILAPIPGCGPNPDE